MSAPATPIVGPTAFGGSPRRFAYLAATLALTDFKLRFFGSVLGYLWQLVRPLLLFSVLYIVFTRFVKLGGAVEFYPVVLLANIVLFTFFLEGTGAVSSLVDRENLVRKIQFPRAAVPIAVVLMAAFNLALNSLVVLALALVSGVSPMWSWLQIPLLLALLAILTAGMAMLLSALYVRFRDVKPIWEVALQLLFYATPVIYTIETIDIDGDLKQILMLNPLAAILEQFRHAVIDPVAPSAAEAAGGAAWLLVPLGIVALAVAVGWRVFNGAAPHIAENL